MAVARVSSERLTFCVRRAKLPHQREAGPGISTDYRPRTFYIPRANASVILGSWGHFAFAANTNPTRKRGRGVDPRSFPLPPRLRVGLVFYVVSTSSVIA